MMSSADMSMLRKASGERFDRAFLAMMIEHHKGAIEMARTEQRRGEYGDAVELAAAIESAQMKEISIMRRLLG